MVINRILTVLLCAAASLQPLAQHTKSTPAAVPSRAAGALDKAETLMQAQQFAQAEEKLQSLKATHANNPQLWFDLGYCQSHLDKTSEAVASYRKAVEQAPSWFEANLNLGIALARSGDRAAAISVLQHATGLKPLSGGPKAVSKAWDSLAQVLEESDPKASAAAYDKAAELDPGNPEVELGAGRMLEKSGDLKAAEARFLKSAGSGNTQGMALLIDLLNQQKRYSEAETWLRKYVTQDPQNETAREQLGKMLAAEGKPHEAITVLEEGAKDPANPALKRELAELFLQTKQYQQAEPLFRELLLNHSSDPELHRGLGVALLYQLKYAAAESELIQAVKLKPDYAEVYGYLADAARENKHYELAIRALDARARFLPEVPMTYFNRATCYDHLRIPKQAIENYKRFLSVAGGKYPDQEFQARHRLKAIEPE